MMRRMLLQWCCAGTLALGGILLPGVPALAGATATTVSASGNELRATTTTALLGGKDEGFGCAKATEGQAKQTDEDPKADPAAKPPKKGGCDDVYDAINKVNDARSAKAVAGNTTAEGGAGLTAKNNTDKTYRVAARTVANNNGTADAKGSFKDPLVVGSETGEAFSTDIVHSLETLTMSGSRDNELSSASTTFHYDMAFAVAPDEVSAGSPTPLFSFDIGYTVGQTPTLSLFVAPALSGVPGWEQSALESQLRALVTAGGTAGVNLGGYAFPAIPFSVPAGQSLILYTTDTAQTNACSNDEPAPIGTLKSGVTNGEPIIEVACLNAAIVDRGRPVDGGLGRSAP
ncbi:hypothetical protein [Gloeobacter violaceus]|uniref:Glr3941 protein n=1 Tax=Gloeobacter violaceus (strain ATCC 29082 / PCC 7421) TaxID=251221 RepID=Q7NED9_GLOVI|nr:hypothetical protein [Gloeobacter violaceus]BAC91882.1 glr3941 [Gloeobacter violaceus PCC 7421]